jgi:hypothetical protein
METKTRRHLPQGYSTNELNIYFREDPMTRARVKMEFYAKSAIAIAMLMIIVVAMVTA